MKEVNVKMSMMHGTDGLPNYLIFSSMKPLVVGIRPVFMVKHTLASSVLVGARIRIANPPNTPEDMMVDVGAHLSKNPTLFNFISVSKERASQVLCVSFPYHFSLNADTVLKRLERGDFFNSFIKYIGEFFQIFPGFHELLITFLKDAYRQDFIFFDKAAEKYQTTVADVNAFYESDSPLCMTNPKKNSANKNLH